MIRLVVALACEARPLIARYGLVSAGAAEGFRVYRGDAVSLIVSGPGKETAATATRYLQAFCGGGRDRAWINVGTGGHPTYPVGKAVLAHKIINGSSGETFYPPLVIERPCETADVLTVDRPEETYLEPAVQEMEAVGFYRAATRFSTAELVQSVKIISDNREVSWRRLTAPIVEGLVRARLEEISAVIEETARLASQLVSREADPPGYSRFLVRWHFTVTERRRLGDLLRRWQVLAGGEDCWSEELARLNGASAVLGWLERRVDRWKRYI